MRRGSRKTGIGTISRLGSGAKGDLRLVLLLVLALGMMLHGQSIEYEDEKSGGGTALRLHSGYAVAAVRLRSRR